MNWADKWRALTAETAKQGAAKLSRAVPPGSQLEKLLRRIVPEDGADLDDALRARAERFVPRRAEVDPPSHGWPPSAAARISTPNALPSIAARRSDLDVALPAADTWPPWRRDGGAAAAVALAPRPLWQADPALEPPVLAPGTCLGQRYEVKRVLARGERLTTCLARHLPWQVDVVLKVPTAVLDRTPMLQAMVDDAERWTGLGFHPHIAYCHHVDVPDGLPLFVVEHLDGGNLRPWITDGRSANLRLGLNLAVQICHGLEHAHTDGFWHGALTPENLLLTADGQLRLTDLGVAARAAAAGQRRRTAEAYVAPEQWVDAAVVDGRTDIFALGVCLYEMFCGGRPYEVARGPRREAPEARRAPGTVALPAGLAALLRRCVDWDPERRPTAVAEVREALCAAHVELFGRPSPFASMPVPTWEADGWNNRALAALVLGDEVAADAAWDNALSADPRHLLATYNAGLTRWRRGDLPDSVVVRRLEQLAAGRGADWCAAYALGVVQLERGEVAAGRALLSDARALAPDVAAIGEALALVDADGAGAGTLRQLSGHRGFVSSVCLLPDGRSILSASDDHTLCLWDATSGRAVRTFDGHAQRVTAVSTTADGAWALSGSDDFSLKLWEVKTGRCVKTINTPGTVFSVALSADGTRALWACSGSDNFLGVDNTLLQVWDLERDRRLGVFEGHRNAAKSVALSADGRWAVSGGDDQTVRVWDATTGACRRVLEGHEHYVATVCVSADGQRALSGSWDQTMRLWDTATGRCLRIFRGASAIVTSVCLSADGRLAVSGSWDGTVRIWEIDTGRCVRTFEGHTRMVTGVALSGDGRTAVSASWDQSVRVWAVPQAHERAGTLQLSQREPYARLPSPDPDAAELLEAAERAWQGQRLDTALIALRRARASDEGSAAAGIARLWRALAGVCIRTRLLGAHPSGTLATRAPVNAVRLGPNGGRALAASATGSVQLWDTALERCARTFVGHADAVWDVVCSADESVAVSASGDGALRVWDVARGTCARVLSGHRSVVTSVSLSADQRWALSGSYDHTARLWALASGECTRVLRGHTRQVTAVCLSSDGQRAITGSYDGTIRLWDCATGQCMRVLDGNAGPIAALRLGPNAQWLLAASADHTLRRWSLEDGSADPQRFEGQAGTLVALDLSTDGRWALTVGRDGGVQLWDIAAGTGTLLCTHDDGLTAAALSPDGCWAILADGAGVLHLLELDWDLQAPAPAAG